jgi:chromosome segregation ATPase
MPFEIGNIFGSKSRRAAPVEHNQAESTATLQGAQKALGRANKALETKTDELKAAQVRLSELDLAIGQTLADDGDASADIQERQSLQSRIQQLESATAVLRQRRAEADAALKNDERGVAASAIVEARMSLLALAPEWEKVFVTVNQLAIETASRTDRLRVVGGNEKYARAVTEISRQVGLFAGVNLSPVTGHGRLPERLMRYETLTACFESLCNVGNHDEHH